MRLSEVMLTEAPTLIGSEWFSSSALEHVLMNAASAKSRWTVVQMSPADFLRMAKPGNEPHKAEVVAQALAGSHKFSDVPFLWIENHGNGTACVVGHEGRHRCAALVRLGVPSIPVAIMCRECSAGPAIRWGCQDPDDHDRVDPMPTVLYGEDTNRSNSMPLPVSLIYPQHA